MNVREMRLKARSLIRENQVMDAHFLRFLNSAYREISRAYIIPRLHSGSVTLTVVSGSTQNFYLPYDHSRVISFYDSNGRSLDVLRSEDVRQFNEYNALGSFVCFYEYSGVNLTPLYDSVAASVTCAIANRGTTVTASSAIFTSAHVGEWLLPLDYNTSSSAGNPEDYAYLISATTGTTAVPVTTCTLTRPFRGVISDAGAVGSMTTAYFQVRPVNTPIIRIWGLAGSAPTVYCEYQRVPSKLANNEDVPEEPRLCEALVYRAIQLSGWGFRDAFMVKTAQDKINEALGAFQTCKDYDKKQIHNFLTANPQNRTYSQIAGRHVGQGYAYSHGGIRY